MGAWKAHGVGLEQVIVIIAFAKKFALVSGLKRPVWSINETSKLPHFNLRSLTLQIYYKTRCLNEFYALLGQTIYL
jgi:hypothetical protein